jgi:hypothetical protein
MNIGNVLTTAAGAGQPAAAGLGAVAAALARATTPAAASTGATAAGPALSSLGPLLRGAAQAALQRGAGDLGSMLAGIVKKVVGGTSAAAATSTRASGSSSSLAFLKDPRLSVEEKLARLMVHLSDKYEKQLEEKLRQYGDLEAGKATSTSTARKGTASASPLAALGDGLKSLLSKAGLGSSLLTGTLLPQLATQVAAPVLAGAATALGMPALAPMLLKAGPLLGSLAAGAVSALTGKSASTSTAAASSGASADAPSEKQLMTEIQILQEKQKEMFALVSNILRSMHDTKMAVIGNIR